MAGNKDLRRIRSGGNREISKLLLGAVKAGHRYKMTRSGIILYGPAGIAGTHFGSVDSRAARNLRADFRRVGITIKEGRP